MFILSILVALVSIGFFLYFVGAKHGLRKIMVDKVDYIEKGGNGRDYDQRQSNAEEQVAVSFIGMLGTGAFALVFLFLASVTIIQAGHVGFTKTFGVVDHVNIMGPGVSFVRPYADVVKMSTKTDSYNVGSGDDKQSGTLIAKASTGLKLSVDISMIKRLDPQSASCLYENFRENYTSEIVKPVYRSSVRRGIGSFEPQEVIATKRDEVEETVAKVLQAKITSLVKARNCPGVGIFVDTIALRKADQPLSVQEAVEEKEKEKHKAEAMEHRITREIKEAKRKEEEAKGIAEFQKIVNSGITADLLEWKRIEAKMELAKTFAQSTNKSTLMMDTHMGNNQNILLDPMRLNKK